MARSPMTAQSDALSPAEPSRYLTFFPADRDRVRLRLVCFPYAGAGTSIYNPWSRLFPPYVQVAAVQLPARESRVSEQPVSRLLDHIRPLMLALAPLFGGPVAFFGHSMGALLAFEAAHALYATRRLLPIHLFVSGCKAPHLSRADRKRDDFTDAELLEEIERLNGTPRELLEHPELSSIILPVLRSDFLASDNYECEPREPLRCPITAIGGEHDPFVDRAGLEAWRQHTTSAFAVQFFPGDHFFLNSTREALTRFLRRILDFSFYLAP